MTVAQEGSSPPRGRPAPAATSSTTPTDLIREMCQDPAQRTTLFGGLACLGLFALLFRDNFEHFYSTWTSDDNYSHGFLVPLLSLYFASLIVRRGPAPVQRGLVLGTAMLGLAIVVRLLTIPLPIFFLSDVALLVGLAGVFTLLAGGAALRRYWFPFFFLVFMVPLPIAMYSRIASPLQLLASQAASAVMNASGVPVLCEGNRMTLPGGVQMFVAEACSGMRQMTGFLALTTAVAYLSRRPGWCKAVIVAAALPIALTANVARIVLTGYIMHFVNPQYASGAYHTLEGVLMMGFGLLLLNSLCALLNRIVPDSAPESEEAAEALRCDDQAEPAAAPLPLPARAVFSGSAGWSGRPIADNLMPLRAPKELP